MIFDLETSNLLVALGTVGLNLATIALLYLYLFKPSFKFPPQATLWVAFVLTAGASLVTLYYSWVLGQLPCRLCWAQRVFLYPQAFIFLLAAWKRDLNVWLYSIALSAVGSIFALYQHYLQLGGTDFWPCPAVGGALDCAQRTLFEFGYITYPFMAFSLFVFLILLMLILKRSEQKSLPGGAA